MDLSTAQLCLLRCLDHRGFETGLLDTFIARCGATPEEFEALKSAGYLQVTKTVSLSDIGRRAYRRGRVGRYF